MSFATKLEEASAAWVSDGLISADQRAALLTRHPNHERGRRAVIILSLAGAAVVVLGVTLLVASNWGAIPRLVKLGSGSSLMSVLFAAGYQVAFGRLALRRTGEALMLVGSGAFLGTLTLISQQYHIHGDIASLTLVFFLSLVPFAYVLHSRAYALLMAVAFAAWPLAIMAGADPFGVDEFGFAPFLFACGIGAGIVAFGTAHRLTRFHDLAPPIEIVGGAIVFVAVFVLGFYRHDPIEQRLETPGLLLLLGLPLAAVLAVAAVGLFNMSARFERRELSAVFAGAVCISAMLVWAIAVGLEPRPSLVGRVPNPDASGGEKAFALWTGGFWVLYATLAVSLAWLGARFRRDWWLNCALVAIGVFVIARYFDLFRNSGLRGFTFVGAGALLIALALVLERSRRALIAASRGGAS